MVKPLVRLIIIIISLVRKYTDDVKRAQSLLYNVYPMVKRKSIIHYILDSNLRTI